MGWTSYRASYWKKGNIDRKKECDAYFEEGLNKGHYKILKSSMVGTTYYAAVQHLVKYVGKNEKNESIYEPIENGKIFAAIFLTSVDTKDFFNFSYKDMDESEGPYQHKCPVSILKLLSPTDNEYAKEWRKACYKYHENEKSPNSLKNLPIDAVINWTTNVSLKSGLEPGQSKRLVKRKGYKTSYWFDGYYRYSSQLLKNYGSYSVISIPNN